MNASHQQQDASGRLVLACLFTSGFALMPAMFVVTLFLIEIAQTFGTSVGAMGQIQTVSSIIQIVSALLMGALSIRFGHRTLLMIGLGILGLSALGCFAAVDLSTMFVAYALVGLGSAVTLSMATTLVGEHLPLSKRSSAIGVMSAGQAIAGVVSPTLINYIAGLGGWHYAFLIYALPIPIIGLLLVAKSLPIKPPGGDSESTGGLAEGFREVLSNRSAVACVAGTILAMAAWQAILFYGVSFFRKRFSVSSAAGSAILTGWAIVYTLGTLWSGQLVNRFGRKPFAVFTVLAFSIFIFLYANLPSRWLSLAIAHLGSFFAGLRYTATTSLALEQVPRFRGTMMSIIAAASGMGSALGSAVGGVALQWFDWGVLGISLGLLGIIAGVIFALRAADPTKT